MSLCRASLVSLACLVALGCVTTDMQEHVEVAKQPTQDRDYGKALDKATQAAKLIDNFETRYAIEATYLSPEFRAAFGERMRELFLKQDETLQESGGQAAFFVSLFSPDDGRMQLEDDDYWTILLTTGGEARPPVLIKPLPDKLKWEPFFPYVSPWSREFLVVFDAASVAQGTPSLVEKSLMQVTFANADGKVKLGW